MLKREDLNFFSTYLLAEEAQKRGIRVSKIFPKTKRSYLKLEYDGKKETIIGQRISSLSYNAFFICNNKEVTRTFLKENGIATTEGQMFYKNEMENAIDYSKKIGYPVVAKPVDGTWGKNVFLELKNEEQVKIAIEKILGSKERFLIEKQFIGHEYRILATNQKLLGVINRIPANVVGDGKSTIKELIEIKNKDPRRGEGHSTSLVRIKIDEDIIENLQEQNLNLESIPQKDKQILLRKNSNLSTGGDSIDITDEIHPKIKELAPKIIASIPNLPYAGFDFMTPDITKDPDEVGYAVIEINDSPMLSMHHFPYIGKERNVAKDVIDIAFPETKK